MNAPRGDVAVGCVGKEAEGCCAGGDPSDDVDGEGSLLFSTIKSKSTQAMHLSISLGPEIGNSL